MSNMYVPVLKWKRGEQKAIDELDISIKSKIMPLIEIPPIPYDYENEEPAKTIDQHIENFCRQVEETFKSNSVFLDLYWIEDETEMNNGQHPLISILEEASQRKLKLIPVIGCNRSNEYNSAIKEALQDKLITQICLRLETDDYLDIENKINDILQYFDIDESEAHLVIDLKYVLDGNTNILIIPTVINAIPNIGSWQSLTFCGTSFPEDLSHVQSDSISNIERIEWSIWKGILKRKHLIKRIPQFGDYIIANPMIKEIDPRTMQISDSIRYTGRNDFIIFKGHSTKVTTKRPEGWTQMHKLSSQVIKHKEYAGSHFSWGDSYIYDCANKVVSTSNAERWRKVGTNHHLSLVISQLSNLSYF